IWGGEAMVQRGLDALADAEMPVAILPAGTGNLLATSLGIPGDVAKAVDIGFKGTRRKHDLGVMNGERFAAMAGAGFDAIMVHDTGTAEKEKLGRMAYFRSSLKAMRARSVRMRIRRDGETWFTGKASCVLIGNIGTVTGGIEVFAGASDSDGQLELGVVTAKNAWQWAKVFSEMVVGLNGESHLIEKARGRKIDVKLKRSQRYELDGGARPRTKRLKVRI